MSDQGQSAGPGATRDTAMGGSRESGWGRKRHQKYNVENYIGLFDIAGRMCVED